MISKQWKRKQKQKRVNFIVVEAEAEAASFKKVEAEVEALHAEAEAEAEEVKNSPLPHHWYIVYSAYSTKVHSVLRLNRHIQSRTSLQNELNII